MLGVVAGACATWMSQGRHRRDVAAQSGRSGEVARAGRGAEVRSKSHFLASGAAARLNECPVRIFSAEDVDAALDFPALIDALAEAMRGGFVAPRPPSS